MTIATASLAVGALVVVTLVALMSLPVNLRLTVADSRLVVEPRGLDVLWTLRRRVEVPIEQVTSIRVLSRAQAPALGLRLPGAYLPGVIIAGSYGLGDQRTFWDARRGDPLLVVYCRAGSPYRALVLEFPDPHAVLAGVRPFVAR